MTTDGHAQEKKRKNATDSDTLYKTSYNTTIGAKSNK